MEKKKAQKLIKEFEKAHNNYSGKRIGYWGKDWKKELKYADLKNGHWRWKGYDLVGLYDLLKN